MDRPIYTIKPGSYLFLRKKEEFEKTHFIFLHTFRSDTVENRYKSPAVLNRLEAYLPIRCGCHGVPHLSPSKHSTDVAGPVLQRHIANIIRGGEHRTGQMPQHPYRKVVGSLSAPDSFVNAVGTGRHLVFRTETTERSHGLSMTVTEYHVGFSIVRTILSPVDTNNEVIDRGCR